MQQKWKYAVGLVAIVIAGGVIAAVVTGCGPAPTILLASDDVTARLEAARLACRQAVIAISAGPVVIIATLFHLVYTALSMGLALLALLICLANCLVLRRA